jgi:hypothetical protein
VAVINRKLGLAVIFFCCIISPIGAKEQDTNKKNISFASQHLTYLPTVQFKAPIPPAARIIFVHPPKTGGTTLCYVTEALTKTNLAFKATRFTVPRIDGQSPGKIYENWLGGLKSAYIELEKNRDCCNDMNFISGHFPFGLHSIMGIEAKYIVLVRNPIEREISNTNFDFQRGYLSRESAKEYLMTANIDNPQTRMLAGIEYMHGICDESVLAIAKNNIENYFILAGVTEDTNSFIQILASIQGWGSIALTKAQVTGDKAFSELDTEYYKLLADKHKFDLQLYEWVRARWFAWKQENIAQSTITANTQPILCILPEFASTRTPIFMTLNEIEEYNMNRSDELVQVNQDHFGLKPDLSKK